MTKLDSFFFTPLICLPIFLAFLLCTGSGCKKIAHQPDQPSLETATVPASAPVDEPEVNDDAFLLHIITYPGETLTLIARWYTGDAANWRRIADLNSITSPTALRIGQTIAIPREMLKRNAPMPRSAVEELMQPAQPSAPPAPSEHIPPEPVIPTEHPQDGLTPSPVDLPASPPVDLPVDPVVDPHGDSIGDPPSDPSDDTPAQKPEEAPRTAPLPSLIIAPPR